MHSLITGLKRIASDPDFVNLRSIEGIQIELKYATKDNFMGRNVYGEFNEPFLHREAATKLKRALQLLRAERPSWTLLIYDALRPRSVQRLLWAHVAGSPQEAYVANPDRGSMHNYGCAVDLTATDLQAGPVDMGTDFDTFHPKSQPKLEEMHLQTGELTQTQIENRWILRRAMTGAGFIQLPHEWWHFDAFPGDEVRTRFRIIE